MNIKSVVETDFSAVAAKYDRYAFAQRFAAQDLLTFTGSPPAKKILEPGCGTGIYTQLLLEAFPDASLVAIDICEEMLQLAREKIVSPAVEFSIADAEELIEPSMRPPSPSPLPKGARVYDLITSNASFQWFQRLPATLDDFVEMLADDGMLSFSFFGSDTYHELDSALQETTEVRTASSRFPGRSELTAMLKANRLDWSIEEKRYTHVFPSLKELLLSIRYTGTWGRTNESHTSWSPAMLARTERVYIEQWDRIQAAYQVYFCKARK
jgi:malonyl-CoA O-methyltransferase